MSDIHAVDVLWKQTTEKVPDHRVRLSLKQGYLVCADGSELTVIFASSFHHAAVTTDEGRNIVGRAICEAFGEPYRLRCLLMSQEDWQRLQGHFYTSRALLMAAIY
jgi:hypothetical protein